MSSIDRSTTTPAASESGQGAPRAPSDHDAGLTLGQSLPVLSQRTAALMSAPPPRTDGVRSVALIGNPNTGKTTLFNALTGYRRHAANYPGVTVEIGRGRVRRSAAPLELIDLPGTYSLVASSPDERIVSDVLAGRSKTLAPPDVVVAIVDASNLPRNLYLVSQLLEYGRPTVVALNMIDVARARGLEIDVGLLAERLGVPVVPLVATRSDSVAGLVRAIETIDAASRPRAGVTLPAALAQEVHALCSYCHGGLCVPEACRALLDQDNSAAEQLAALGLPAEKLLEARARLQAAGCHDPTLDVRVRYQWVRDVLAGVVKRPPKPVRTWSDRLDRVLTHKVFGAIALLIVLGVLFQAIFSWAGPLMAGIEAAIALLADFVGPLLPAGVLRSLVVVGIIKGVGAVLVFLPQIAILFAFIAVLEDCGYLARAAYMMDRIMRGLGLSGRAFVPLLSSFACAVPAIMGARTIADRRERVVTILLAPLMSCSARLPIYILLIAAFVPTRGYLGGWVNLQGIVMLGMYLVGAAVAVPVAWVLRKTVLRGPASGFMIELPSYKPPRPVAIWQRVSGAAAKFIVSAGTMILVVNLFVWALAYFPRSAATEAAVVAQAREQGWSADRTAHELEGAYLRSSFLGRIGHAIEPAIRPLGWDWRIGMAVAASLPAREVVVSTLGTIFNLGEEVDEDSASLREALATARRSDGTPLFTLPVALSIMVFFALCLQCTSTLVVMGRETGSWLWPLSSFAWMTALAYVAAWATYSISSAFAG